MQVQLALCLAFGNGSRPSTNAMANLAEAIQGLVGHMRNEQQLIRDWVNGQSAQQEEVRKLLERIARTEGRLARDDLPRLRHEA